MREKELLKALVDQGDKNDDLTKAESGNISKFMAGRINKPNFSYVSKMKLFGTIPEGCKKLICYNDVVEKK